MLRMSYMPSDFHPVLLVLGQHAELQRFSDALARFAGTGQETALVADGHVFSTDTEVILRELDDRHRYGLWPDADRAGLLYWSLPREDAAAFAAEVADLAASGAPAGSVTLECDLLGEVKAKVSIGEWEDHFLTDEVR